MACEKNEFVYLQSFEYHFLPEEYEQQFYEFEKQYKLEPDVEYEYRINVNCDDGQMNIIVKIDEQKERRYLVETNNPCEEKVKIEENSSKNIRFSIIIENNTNGEIKAGIYSLISNS